MPSNGLLRAAALSAQLCASVSYLLQILLDSCRRIRSHAMRAESYVDGRSRHLGGTSIGRLLILAKALLACLRGVFDEALHFLELGFHLLIY